MDRVARDASLAMTGQASVQRRNGVGIRHVAGTPPAPGGRARPTPARIHEPRSRHEQEAGFPVP